LRRLKSDPTIAAALGEKREIREYCDLTKFERAAYEEALADYRAGEKRQGDVFALITRLKLVCDGADDFAHGSKLARLLGLLDEIFAAGESALVFTQYAKVGAMLANALEAKFGSRVSFMHGGLSASRREEEIARFRQSGNRVFVLSLKTGGYGLNLVKATHVIHFDRWWNPAVEAQATDRAHRIGQTGTVFVHKFMASGTLEERVDAILERKSAAALNLVESGESFLASLPRDEFEKSVALSQ
jgi:SNF2 family DNA or RNA helicase